MKEKRCKFIVLSLSLSHESVWRELYNIQSEFQKWKEEGNFCFPVFFLYIKNFKFIQSLILCLNQLTPVFFLFL